MSEARVVSPRFQVPKVFLPLDRASRRYLGARGGRGSGKSHYFAEKMVDLFLETPSLRAMCVREIQLSLRHSSKLLIEDKIRKFEVSPWFKVLDTMIICPSRRKSQNDGIIVFQGMQNHTAESVKSYEDFDIAWIEEGQSISESSLTKLRPTIRKPGSQIWASWNPLKPSDPVEMMFMGGEVTKLSGLGESSTTRVSPHPESICVTANYYDNPWFWKSALVQDMEYDKRRDPEKYRHIWLGEHQSRSEARVFHNFSVEEFETPKDAVFYHGADWGFATDPTVLVRCFILGRNLYFDREVWKVGCEMDHTPALFDNLDPTNSGSARSWTIVADSSNPQAISYMVRHGYKKMQRSVKGPGSIEEGINFLKSYDVVIHPRCQHLIDEFSSYSYEVDKRSEQVLPKLSDKKNHTIDAARYAIEGVRRKNQKPVFASY